MECIELNWLFKHTKKVRSSQAAILVLNWEKQFFPVNIVKPETLQIKKVNYVAKWISSNFFYLYELRLKRFCQLQWTHYLYWMHVSCAYDAFKNICWERLMNIQFSSCVHKNRRLHADALSKKTSLTLWDSDLTLRISR